MHKPRFSIIILCSHSGDMLNKTLRAISELDYLLPYEVIVLDDGLTDGREKAVIGAVNRGLDVRYYVLSGISRADAWNYAVRESAGEFLAFLDDDCIPPHGWLQAFEKSFDGWVVGVVGGPDRVPDNANVFERCLEYVLTSFSGTLGMRSGLGRVSQYYPRPWNMAARKEAIIFSGGFDESSPEAPEVPMIRRLEKVGYRATYQPDAILRHHRETGVMNFIF